MALPAGATTITLTGTFTDVAGNTQSGSILIAPTSAVFDGSGKQVLTTAPVPIAVSNGTFSQVLPASDNANWTPLNWQYHIVVNVPGYEDDFTTYLPSTLGPSIDITELGEIPNASPPPTVAYIPDTSQPPTQGPSSGGGFLYSEDGTLRWAGTGTPVVVAPNSSTLPMTTLGDMVYGGASGTPERLPIGATGQALTVAGGIPSWGLNGGTTVTAALPTGATATDTPNLQAAITSLANALSFGPATLQIPDGTYQVDGNALVIQNLSNFTIRAGHAAITQAPNTDAKPDNVTGNLLTIADCTDFRVEGLTLDGLRDTVAPLTPLAAAAAAGQPSVTVAAGDGARYQAGQRLAVWGGLGSSEQNQSDGFSVGGLTILSITAGGGTGGGDLITFTANLGNSYTQLSSVLVSDPYGPYACAGAYVSPYQTGSATVAGRLLEQEDQQCGLHLINCHRFAVTGNRVRNVWESPIRCGTHITASTVADNCTYGTICGNVASHGYDQGVGIWTSDHNTVAGNVISSCGWAGISCTLGDDNTITGNVISDNVYQVAGDLTEGNGVAVEGGCRNVISDNVIRGNYGRGVYLTAAGTQTFSAPEQVQTTVAAASNAQALPQATINVASTGSFAASGSIYVLSSAGVQFITYTGKTSTSFTGCTGGAGTLYTSQIVAQVPLFISNGGVPLPIGSTSIPTTDGTKFQVDGRYSIIDGPRTERIQVASISASTITLTEPTKYGHWDQTQIGPCIPEDNTISGNNISSVTGASPGVQPVSAVRTSISANTIHGTQLYGIDGVQWSKSGLNPPAGTSVIGNVITFPGTALSYAPNAIAFNRASDIVISGNRVTGAPSTTATWSAISLQGCTDCSVTENVVADASGQGIVLSAQNEWVCKRVRVAGNLVQRTIQEGIQAAGGDALMVADNILRGCAPLNGPGGTGGALSITGCTGCLVTGNICEDNGHGGLIVGSATIDGATVYTSGCTFARNICRDDGFTIDAFNGAASRQAVGIQESSGNGPNTYTENVATGNTADWSLAGTGSAFSPGEMYSPGLNELLVAPSDPATASATQALTAGTLYLVWLPVFGSMTISKTCWLLSSNGSGASSGTYTGLYSASGVLLTGSADIAASLTGPLAQLTLTTPQTVTTGVWAALLVNYATTQPALYRYAAPLNNLNAGLPAASYRAAVNGTGLSSLPASITPASNTQVGAYPFWAGGK